MTEVFYLTLPIFILILLGLFAVGAGLVSKTGIAAMGKFVVTFALPAMLFRALSERSITEIFKLEFLSAYAAGSVVAMAIGFSLAKFWRGKSLQESTFHGMGGAMSNSGFMGYPIVFQLFGTPGAVAVALAMIVENVVILPVTLMLAEAGSAGKRHPMLVLSRALRRLLTSPLILAIAAGLLCAGFGLTLPSFVTRAVDLLAAAAAPVALFVVGGILYGQRVRGMVADVVSIATVKLVAHPLVIFLALMIVPPFDPVLQSAALILACMPMASIFPLLGKMYGYESVCSGALVVATAVSFASISVVIWMVGAIGPAAAGG